MLSKFYDAVAIDSLDSFMRAQLKRSSDLVVLCHSLSDEQCAIAHACISAPHPTRDPHIEDSYERMPGLTGSNLPSLKWLRSSSSLRCGGTCFPWKGFGSIDEAAGQLLTDFRIVILDATPYFSAVSDSAIGSNFPRKNTYPNIPSSRYATAIPNAQAKEWVIFTT